jgi:hypothetical protein
MWTFSININKYQKLNNQTLESKSDETVLDTLSSLSSSYETFELIESYYFS